MKKEEDKKTRVKIEINAKDVKGEYCNMAGIHHSESEFVLDFAFVMGNQGKMVSRVITNPQHAKAIALALSDNIKKYEDQYGEIKAASQSINKPLNLH